MSGDFSKIIRKMRADLAKLNAELTDFISTPLNTGKNNEISTNVAVSEVDNGLTVNNPIEDSSDHIYESENDDSVCVIQDIQLLIGKSNFQKESDPISLQNGKDNDHQERRDNSENYRRCNECEKPSAYHRNKVTNICESCRLKQYRKRKKNNRSVRTVRNESKSHPKTKGPMSQEEFRRNFMVAKLRPFILPNGQKVCATCHHSKIEMVRTNMCKSCHGGWMGQKRLANPKSYRKCRQCNKIKYHQGIKSSECNNCYQRRRRSKIESKLRPANRLTTRRSNRQITTSSSSEDVDVSNQFNNDENQTRYSERFYLPKSTKVSRARQLLQRAIYRPWKKSIQIKRHHSNKIQNTSVPCLSDFKKENNVNRSFVTRSVSSTSQLIDILNATGGKVANWYKPVGWKKGQCKICRLKLRPENMSEDFYCVNYCKNCYETVLNQCICVGCNQKKRHFGNGFCRNCHKKCQRKHNSRIVKVSKRTLSLKRSRMLERTLSPKRSRLAERTSIQSASQSPISSSNRSLSDIGSNLRIVKVSKRSKLPEITSIPSSSDISEHSSNAKKRVKSEDIAISGCSKESENACDVNRESTSSQPSSIAQENTAVRAICRICGQNHFLFKQGKCYDCFIENKTVPISFPKISKTKVIDIITLD